MEDSTDQEKIFKSWSGIREVSLIKEVATKGKHIQLCIIYGARKRKMSTGEYELIFHDIVQTYVDRLLNEKLVCKAETVLRNVQRDVKCFLYEFACNCNDSEVQQLIIDHLRKKETDFDKQLPDLQVYSQILQELKNSEAMLTKAKHYMKRLNLESLMGLDAATLQHLMIELYFETHNPALLPHINKYAMWEYLVEKKHISQILTWLRIQQASRDKMLPANETDLALKYNEWFIEPQMYEYAVNRLQNNKDEVLRNFFASAGYFFSDEQHQVESVLKRVCLTESFERNLATINKLNLGRFLYERRMYNLLLQSFVSDRQMDELINDNPEDGELLRLLKELKTRPLERLDGFEKICFHTCKYIQSVSSDSTEEECNLATLFEFLTHEPSVANLHCAIASGPLKGLSYLRIMHRRQQQNDMQGIIQNNLPTVYDLLKSIKGIDFKRLNKNAYNYSRIARKDHSLGNENVHRLNFMHYIQQLRSAYATYILLMDQLQSYAQITKSHLFITCESVYELALRTATSDTDMLCHCVAFCEMLGFDTQKLRCFLKMKQFLVNNNISWPCDGKSHITVMQETERLLVKRLQTEKYSEDVLLLEEYSAVMVGKAMSCTENCDKESLVMQHYASKDLYWRLLVLLQYFDVPLDQVKHVVRHFATRPMGQNLLRALSSRSYGERPSVKSLQFCGRKKLIKSKRHKKDNKRAMNTSIETITSSIMSSNDVPGPMMKSNVRDDAYFVDCYTDVPDLFALILRSTNSNVEDKQILDVVSFLKIMESHDRSSKQQYSTAIQFLRSAVEQRVPIMAVLAASQNQEHDIHLEWCWLVWLTMTSNQWNILQRLAAGNRIKEFSWNLLEHLVSQGQIIAVVRSFEIFYPSNAIVHLFRFLHLSTQNKFGEGTVHELRLYCLAWSNDEINLPLNRWSRRDKIMKYTIRFFLLHIQNNFQSVTDQLKFLTCVCKSGLSDITDQIDFCLLRGFCDILQMSGPGASQRFSLNFMLLLQEDQGTIKEFERVMDLVLECKEYEVALRLASLLQKPISDIVYSKWVSELETQLSLPFPDGFDDFTFPFEQFEQEVIAHSLPPETLVNFLLYAASHLPLQAYKSRYYVLQKSLNVIKNHHLFPNESFDRDQIEYDMIVNYLLLQEDITTGDNLALYHSEYYEEIMLPERCVLYKSFMEIKELAGIEDLNISNKIILNEQQCKRLESLLRRLLDDGDIVEALRLQELFNVRPMDLRFLVFCMALAESISTIDNMSDAERQLLSEIDRSSFSKFTKRTLCAGPSGSGGGNLSDSSSTLEFEEIPSKDKQETLAILQGIGSKLKFGVNLAKRIISCFRAAMYLDKEYIDVLRTKDVHVLLQRIAEESCMHRLLVVSDILTSTQMQANEIAELLAFEITTAVVRPRFYILSPDQRSKLAFRNADLWGYNIDRDLHLFLELIPDGTKLGACLLEYCDALKSYRKYQNDKPYNSNYYFERLAEIIARYGQPSNSGNTSNSNASDLTLINTNQTQHRSPQVLSHKKQNIIYVELLIKAHQSFVHECSMEGIANVLNRAKVLNNVLAQAKSWWLIVRMLTGIGRYREMYFCFDTLIENEQFESLLGQFEEDKTIGLRQAILGYLRQYCTPNQGKELFKLAALHFMMYKDLAEMWEREVEDILTSVFTSMRLADDSALDTIKLRCTQQVMNQLKQSLDYLIHATENYLLGNKLLLAQKCANKAELIAVQIDLVHKALETPPSQGHHLCFCVIQLNSRQKLKNLINNELSVSQSLILGRAYSYDINWAEALLLQYVIQWKQSYLADFLEQIDLTDDVIENVVKGFQIYVQQHGITKQMDLNITQLVEMVSSITLKYKLASMLSLKPIVLSIINSGSVHFLRDTKFGRREENRNS